MKYKVVFSDKALKDLKKLDKYQALLLTGWIRKNLEDCTNPRQFGKGLSANRSGQWRYRVGKYRLISEITDEIITILILKVGHQKYIYEEEMKAAAADNDFLNRTNIDHETFDFIDNEMKRN